MEFIIALGLGLLILITFFMPWFHARRLSVIEERLENLSSRIDQLAQKAVYDSAAKPEPVTKPEPQPVAEPPVAMPAIATVQPAVIYNEEPIALATEPVMPTATAAQSSKRDSFELNFGAKLPVWIGGIAMAFAGFYLVSYSIEMDLIGPGLQVILGLLFGAGLLGAAYRFGPEQAKIGQSLAGAGIAVLYCAVFVASSYYKIIPPLLGFSGMTAITALAVIMAIRHGAPIAIMGMLGGFLTPLLVGSNSGSTPLLLAYIYVLFTALFWFLRHMQWWSLLLLLTPLGLLWAIGVLFFIAKGGEFIFVSLFLIALCITAIKGTRGIAADLPVGSFGLNTEQLSRYINLAILGAAAVLTGIATAESGYGMLERSLMLLLTAGTVALAWFDKRNFAFAPWLALIVNLFMLISWQNADGDTRMLTLAVLAALYGGAGSWLVWRSAAPLFWALLSSIALGLLYLLGIALEDHNFPRIAIWPYISFPFWGMVAFLIADLMVHQARRVRRYISDEAEVQKLLAVFAAAATGFIAIGLTVELKREFLSIALAAELLALAYLTTRVRVEALRALVVVMGFAFAIVLLPQLVLIMQLGAYSLFEARLPLLDSLPMVRWPAFQLGLPAAMFIAASLYLRRAKDDKLVAALELAAITLIGLMGYYMMRHFMHPNEDVLFKKAGFIERGTFTNILFVFSLACFYIGQRWIRTAVVQAGMVLSLIGLFRLGWFDLLIHNPLFSRSQHVGFTPLFNGVTLTYGLPIIWLHLILRHAAAAPWSKLLRGAQMVLVFAFISLTIRQLYHGNKLTGGIDNAEMYTYSIVWLLFGLGLLVLGTRKNDRTMRIASLVLVTLTVGKVFLIDAAELRGLWRVISFFGLGLSLMGISWFYNRFIFKRNS